MTTAAHRSSSVSEPTAEKWLQMYRRMQMIRHFEDRVNDLGHGHCLAKDGSMHIADPAGLPREN